MMINKPGIYPDIASADYFADPCEGPSLTQSLAKVLIEQSPAHARDQHPRLREAALAEDEPVEKYIAAQAIGNAAHMLMIRRGKEIEIADFDSWRTKEARTFREDAEQAGKTPILIKHFETATHMVNAARTQMINRGCEEAFTEGQGNGEVCIAWCEDGLWFRSLIDWLPTDHRILYDYKTSGMSCAPHGLGRMMMDAGWDIQAAMHERGLNILDPVNAGRRKFRFVAQENEPPYALVVCELTEAVMTMGRKKLEYAIRLWRMCMKSGAWPLYPPEIFRPEYPAWGESQWLAREIHEAAAERHPDRDARNLLAG